MMDEPDDIAPPKTVVAPPPEGAIAVDLPCAICSYNLKGQSAGGVCPECGRPVARTLNEDLRLADPGWLRFQATTMFWLAALCALNFGPGRPWAGYATVADVLYIACGATAGYACWRLARSDGLEPPSDLLASQQRGLRLGGVVMTALIVMLAVPAMIPVARLLRVGAGAQVLNWAFAAVLFLVNWLVALLVLKLARRLRPVPNDLVRHARLALWAMPLSVPLSLVPELVMLTIRGTDPDWSDSSVPPTLYSTSNWIHAAIWFGVALLLGRMQSALARSAEEASGETERVPDAVPSPSEP
jgi:hypothetical protein